MIKIRNLKKSFGDTLVFDNINLDIEKGDCTVIVGASGCGKSTLLRCINRMEMPSGGEVLYEGENIADSKVDIDKIRTKIGMVFQNFNLFSHLNVLENVILAPMCVSG